MQCDGLKIQHVKSETELKKNKKKTGLTIIMPWVSKSVFEKLHGSLLDKISSSSRRQKPKAARLAMEAALSVRR